MATGSNRETAKIYQFPVEKRLANDRKKIGRQELLPEQPSYADCAFGGAWYHEAALHDTDPLPQLRR